MREEIRRIQQETGITTVFVTHDQSEAMHVADKIMVLNDGVIQKNYALYPHMTVLDNIIFPMKMAKVDKTTREAKAKELAKLVRVDDQLNKKPGALSGGQQQRVAIARAVEVLHDMDFELPDGELIAMLGPSGGGKSTTLNLISGLLQATTGQIYFGDTDVTKKDALQRGVGMVFLNASMRTTSVTSRTKNKKTLSIDNYHAILTES
ncbi:ATP-binding cassette domain-containing protein [Weissella confusa]|uniref:ATP-binding cassette domain-containing protein n=1 Tax=Weissella confusa TaxID=1583 RepID=A0A923NGT7_WEICO|nr:ATP-binding cassette domain-containing protein [Weissella confusa]